MKQLQKHIIIDGIDVSYGDSGKGRVVLCLHGWRADMGDFAQLRQELPLEAYRLICLDLPNFGASELTERVVSIEQYSELLESLVQKMKLKDYVLVGHSMGGQIAAWATAQGALQPSSLVLIAAAGVRSDRSLKRKTLRVASWPLKWLTPRRLKDRLYHAIGSDYQHDLPPEQKAVLKNVLAVDVQADVRRIDVPTLLIYGDNDTSTPLRQGQRLAEAIPDAELAVIAGGDHWIHINHAAAIAELMRAKVLRR